MKSVAFVFRSAPHGTSSGREGLDALLAASALAQNIGVFFLSDGVFQLLPGQLPASILARDYIVTFRVLSLYDIEQCYLCAASLRDRGLPADIPWMIDVTILEPEALRAKLDDFDVVLTF